MGDSSEHEDELSDAESIQFVGEVRPRNLEDVDFDEPIYMIEVYYAFDVLHVVVNADSEEEAIRKVIPHLSLVNFESMIVTKLEGVEKTDGWTGTPES